MAKSEAQKAIRQWIDAQERNVRRQARRETWRELFSRTTFHGVCAFIAGTAVTCFGVSLAMPLKPLVILLGIIIVCAGGLTNVNP